MPRRDRTPNEARRPGPQQASDSQRKASSRKRMTSKPSGAIRLNRLLASAGFGSRRQCEVLIEEGRVDVDGETITKLGTTADPEQSQVRVDGASIKPRRLVYYAVNKPVGVVTTNADPQGRPRVIDLVPASERVFPVGRLDRSSEGLILLTNDGELAQRLAHPRFGVSKVYRVTVAGRVTGETMRQMRRGVYVAEGFVRVEGARILKARERATELEIVLREGKNREIRRILARLGHKVQQLRRIAIGPLRLGELPSGAHRIVNRADVQKLLDATYAAEADRGTSKRPGKRKTATKSSTTSTARPAKSAARGGRKQAGKRRDDEPVTGTVIGGEDTAPASKRKQATRHSGAKASGRRSTRTQRPKRSTKRKRNR